MSEEKENLETPVDEVVTPESQEVLADDLQGQSETGEVAPHDEPEAVPQEESQSDSENETPELSTQEPPVEKNVTLSDVNVGDTVRVHYQIIEGGKSRIQPYDGLILSQKGAGEGKTMTIRHIAKGGVGVERIFPVNSPLIKKVDVLHLGNVRRSKLYYLRQRSGKGALKVREKKQSV